MLKAHKFLCLVLCLALFAAFMPVKNADADDDEIVRIGIMRFLNRASGLTNQQADAITDIFTRMLSNSRSIAIVERDRLADIGREHRLSMSGLVDTSTAVEIGRIAGCQYMLLGSVTQFNKTQTQQGFGNLFHEIKYDASVTVDMRVVDVTTSEVVLSMAETGTATRKQSSMNISDIHVQENDLEGLEGEAISNAVSKLGQRIREVVAGEYSQVLNVTGKDVTVNVGASSGARMNGLYLVYADGADIRDMNGRLLGRKNINIAVIKISHVDNEFSVANVAKEGGSASNIRRGDKIMPISSGEAKSLSKRIPKKRPFMVGTASSHGSVDDVDEHLADMAEKQQEQNEQKEEAVTAEPDNAKSIAKNNNRRPANKRAYENKSTDPSKVIATYGLDSGAANTRRIAHINARKLGSKPAAYNKFVELANSYSGDYLAAFKAGEIAMNLGRRDEAKTWLDKALAINPNYEPAQNAKHKLNSAPEHKSKPRRRK